LVTRIAIAVLVLAALCVPCMSDAQRRPTSQASGQGKRTYKWIDEKGQIHYDDSVPPEYANRDRNVLNNQGVRIGFEEGEITPEEREEQERRKAEEATKAAQQAEIAKHDNMLLQTYISVKDIEDLRDRRLELLESQIKVTELYLGNLRKRLVSLQEEAGAFKPYSTEANAPQIPENLAVDLSRTTASINNYERMLAKTRADQKSLRDSFDNDIARFRQLKGG
jgi:hypothetical protein